MKRFFILTCFAIIIFVTAAFVITPKQHRYKDSDFVQSEVDNDQEIGITKEEKEAVYDGDINVYFYKKDDVECKELVPYKLTNVDKRTLHLEITALNNLLNMSIPEGYKTAIITATILNQYTVRQGVASVDLSTFLKIGKGNCTMDARKQQIIKTITQFGNISEVKFLIDGKEIE